MQSSSQLQIRLLGGILSTVSGTAATFVSKNAANRLISMRRSRKNMCGQAQVFGFISSDSARPRNLKTQLSNVPYPARRHANGDTDVNGASLFLPFRNSNRRRRRCCSSAVPCIPRATCWHQDVCITNIDSHRNLSTLESARRDVIFVSLAVEHCISSSNRWRILRRAAAAHCEELRDVFEEVRTIFASD